MGEKTEYVLGELFTFTGALEAGIKIIDQYSRWEVLLSLQQHVGFLASPATPIILLIVGLILIQRSMQQRVSRAIKEATEVELRGLDGKPIYRTPKVPSIRFTLLIVSLGFAMATFICLAWIWNYRPPLPSLHATIYVPPVCRGGNCVPTHSGAPRPKPVRIISAPNGIAIGGGTVTNPTVNNFGISKPPRVIPENLKPELINWLSQNPTKATVSCISPDGEACAVATEWQKLLHNAGWDVPGVNINIGGITAPGVFIRIKGDPIQGQSFELADSPMGRLLGALYKVMGQENVHVDKKQQYENVIQIWIGSNP
jgi:hypothetical protein